jgi:hypothetical protein
MRRVGVGFSMCSAAISTVGTVRVPGGPRSPSRVSGPNLKEFIEERILNERDRAGRGVFIREVAETVSPPRPLQNVETADCDGLRRA